MGCYSFTLVCTHIKIIISFRSNFYIKLPKLLNHWHNQKNSMVSSTLCFFSDIITVITVKKRRHTHFLFSQPTFGCCDPMPWITVIILISLKWVTAFRNHWNSYNLPAGSGVTENTDVKNMLQNTRERFKGFRGLTTPFQLLSVTYRLRNWVFHMIARCCCIIINREIIGSIKVPRIRFVSWIWDSCFYFSDNNKL